MPKKIRRRCKCGCKGITNYGKRYINGHANLDGTYRLGHKHSDKTKKKMSLSRMGNTNSKGYKQTKEAKLKISLARLKCNPDSPYCDAWKDREYRKDLRKNYCESANCKNNFKKLNNHHINLNKKDCRPINIMTLCNSCHIVLHRMLQKNRRIAANPKDYIIISRLDHISYIHKQSKEMLMVKRKLKNE